MLFSQNYDGKKLCRSQYRIGHWLSIGKKQLIDKTGIPLNKESINEKTCCSENLPSPLFACLKTGKGCQRGVIPPFGKRKEGFIFSVYTIMDRLIIQFTWDGIYRIHNKKRGMVRGKDSWIPESQGDNDIIAGRFSNQYGSLFFDRQPKLFEGMNEFKIKRHDNGPLIQVSQRCHNGISKIRYGFRPKF